MDPRVRFTDRVSSYVAARPSYPSELIELLRSDCGLNPSSVVADIGSGTGILARMLCEHAQTVYGVEPNEAMRQAGESFLKDRKNFVSVNGSAESTSLPGTSVDLITVAQAFHWFHPEDTRHEFLRILKPNGWTALIWNNRKLEGSSLAEAYEQLLVTFGTDYEQVKSRGKAVLDSFERFFGHSQFRTASFKNDQTLDRQGFLDRVLSASYMPGREHPRHAATRKAVEQVFEDNQKDGQVTLEYDTNVYYGQMS